MRYKLALFDFDGTLADTAGWFASALNESAARFGFRQLSREEFAMLRGKGNREIIRYLRVPWWKMPAIARDMRQRAAADAHAMQLFPGVGELLVDLRGAGVRIAIVSSNAEATIRRVLGADIEIDYFECGTSIFGKSARFRRVLKRAGLGVADAIAIGDEGRDIQASRATGIVAGAVAWGYATPDYLRSQSPDIMFGDLADIRRTLLQS
jgi:phosphoglycolate phosphatase